MIKDLLLLTVFPACMAFAAAYDLFTMTLPNKLAIALVVGFLVLAPLVGLSWHQMGIQLGIAFIALAIGFVLFARGWIGGGDAKLFAATALWFSPLLLLQYVLMASIWGGALTLVILGFRRYMLPAVFAQQGWMVRLHDPSGGIPYGIALAAAGLMLYSQTPFMMALGH